MASIARASHEQVLAGGGEMGALMRGFDWNGTPVGPPEHWPQSLRTALGMLLDASHPMMIAWGPSYTQFYNDSFRPILGATKHPAALGGSTRDSFAEIWEDFVGPLFDRIMTGGPAIFLEDQLVPLDRNGFLEECYFTFGYSPIRSERGAVGGVLVTCLETSARVIGERRIGVVREVAARALEARTVAGACTAAAGALALNPQDVPFALLYLLEEGGRRARLASSTGLGEGETGAPALLELAAEGGAWPLAAALTAPEPLVVHDLQRRIGRPVGPWPEQPQAAVVVPLAAAGQPDPCGFFVCGVSARHRLDERYLDFVALLGNQVGTGWGAPAQRRRCACGPRGWPSSTAPRPPSSPT